MNPMLRSAKEIVCVRVEYDVKGERRVKEFSGARAVVASRSFYKEKMLARANPRVIGAKRAGD